MKFVSHILAISALALLPCLTLAETPVVFQRDSIVIHPKLAPIEVVEEGAEPTMEAILPPRGPLELNVEIRPQDALRLEWIHTLNTLSDTNGVLIVLEEAIQVPLQSLQVFTPLDVIVIDANGIVSQLIPNVVLAQLNQEIVAQRPTKAFLYLKAGSIALQSLEPGDRVEHPYFTPNQTVLQ